MGEGGKILHQVLRRTLDKAGEGVKLIELDGFAEELIRNQGAQSSFKRVKGYKWTLCTCVNDVVVHGIPTDYILKKGDLIGIDCGVYHQGFHTDAAVTKIIGDGDKALNDFISTGRDALTKAIQQVKIGNYIHDISQTIQQIIEKKGYSVVRNLVGHGVGRNLHEEPEVPGFVNCVRIKTPRITSGMVLAIEVIYNMGSSEVIYSGDDGWTIATKDGRISGLFEDTVAATSRGNIVLT